ncbi:MAG: hypothetical protein RLZZ599_802 [Bacteroidota bacterium]|jgi:membrane protein implicated in regulation of membrane protease activity
MNRALRLVEILWLGVAAVSAVEIYMAWGNWTRTIQFTLFLGAAIFMYFLRRRSRLRAMNK